MINNCSINLDRYRIDINQHINTIMRVEFNNQRAIDFGGKEANSREVF